MFTFKSYYTYTQFVDCFESVGRLFEEGFDVEVGSELFSVKFGEDDTVTIDLSRLNDSQKQATMVLIKSAMDAVSHRFRKDIELVGVQSIASGEKQFFQE
jgi:hypothetical protein